MSAREQTEGDVLGGRYALRERLGSGAMGTVYRARQLLLDRDVAVKVLRGAVDARACRRLHREARAVARIHNPHVVQVFDYGEAEDGSPYLVMELIEGPTVEARLRGTSASLGDVLQIADGLLAGLAAAHARGVLHRDLKPANMLLRDGSFAQPVVVDFGIAAVLHSGATSAGLPVLRAEWVEDFVLGDPLDAAPRATPTSPRRSDDSRITREGTVVGTPLYMAPEQALGHDAGPQADLYAIGVLLFEWLTGAPPFQGSALDVMKSHAFRPTPPLVARLGLELPEPLRRVVMTAMQKAPRDRYLSAAAMREALRAALPSSAAGPAATLPSGPSLREPPRSTLATVPGKQLLSEVPVLGRGDVFARIEFALDDALAGGGGVVMVEGAPGMGRSRIVAEVAARVAEAGRAVVGRGAAGSDLAALGPAKQAMEDLLHTRSLGSEGLRDRLEAMLGPRRGRDDGQHLSAEERGALMTWIRPELGAGGEGGGDWVFALIERALRVLAARQPVLLVLDDVDRAAPDVQRWLQHLLVALRLAAFPLCVLVTRASIAAGGGQPGLAALPVGDCVLVPLAPLRAVDAQSIAAALLPLTGAAAAAIAARAGGSPRIVVQMVRQLAQADRFVPLGRRLALPDGEDLRAWVPVSLREELVARVDRGCLTAPDPAFAREVLQVAAILPEPFTVSVLDEALRALGERHDPERLEATLDHLIGASLLRDGAPHTADELSFDHPALADVLFDWVSGSRRGRRRGRELAVHLLSIREPRRSSLAHGIVRLLEAAGLDALVVEPALLAGSRALAVGRSGEAERLFGLAEQHGAGGEPLLRALEGRAEAAQLMGRHRDAAERLERLLGLLPVVEAPLRRARTQARWGRALLASGDHEAAWPPLHEGVATLRSLATHPESATELARGLAALSALAASLPAVEVPEVDAEQLLAAVSTPHDRYVVCASLGALASRRGDHHQAVVLAQSALSSARQSGHRGGEVTSLFDLAWAERRTGRGPAAIAHLRDCLTLAGLLHRHPMEARCHNELGELFRAAGRIEEARTQYAEAVALAELVEGPEPVVAALNLALLDVDDDAAEQARSRLLRLRQAGRVPTALDGPFALTLAVCEAAVDADAALESMRTGLRLLGPGRGDAADRAAILDRLAGLWERLGRPDAAREARQARAALGQVEAR